MDTMNSYERVMAAIRGEPLDRVPVIPSVREWCIRQAGFTFNEAMRTPEKYVFSQYYCVKEYKYDAVWDFFAIHAESEALGSRLLIAEDIPPPSSNRSFRNTPQTWRACGCRIHTRMEDFPKCSPLSAG